MNLVDMENDSKGLFIAAYSHQTGIWSQIPVHLKFVIKQASPMTIQAFSCVKNTPQRYLFLGSTRYYTIFCHLIRLSHDINDIL